VAEENEALFKEIEEELRQDKADEIWKVYGNYFVGAALSLVIGVGAYQGWKTYDLDNRNARGEIFEAARALSVKNKPNEALDAFSALAKDQNDGYSFLARFREAGLLSDAKDHASAADIYKSLSANADLPKQYSDLAIVLGALQELDGKTGSSVMGDQLAGILDAKNPWRHSAREISGLIALKNGDRKKARALLKELAEDATAPQGLAQRANEMLKTIIE